MDKPRFDAQTGMLLLDEYLATMPTFQKIMADGIVTDNQLAEQGHRVMALFRDLDATLPSATKSVVTTALCELAVLYALYRKRLTCISVQPVEQEYRRERQAVGITVAKRKGVYRGRLKGTTKAKPARKRYTLGGSVPQKSPMRYASVLERSFATWQQKTHNPCCPK